MYGTETYEMSRMPLWRPRIVDSAPMKYLGIVEALEADVRAGRIRPGDRLPPHRAIAEALNVDLTTVTRAFNEARRRGLVDAQAGRGSFISEDFEPGLGAGVLGGALPVLLSMNAPPQPQAADLARLIPRTIADLLSGPRGGHNLSYRDNAGADSDRIAAASWLGGRIDGVSPDQVVVAAGAQSALFAILESHMSAGDVIAAAAVTYPGLKAIATERGLDFAPLAIDEGGILPDAFEAACRERAPRALYVIPAIDNPTTATLSEDRRRALISIARRHEVFIIEDDPYSRLQSRPVTPFASLAPDITWHIATLSKCVTPALRVAYVVAPTSALALRIASILRVTILMAPPLMAALASRWIADGVVDRVTAAIRAENAERQKIAAAILHGARFAADPEGHHLWLQMPPRWRATDFAQHAERFGVAIVPSSMFSVTSALAEAVRISVGAPPDRGYLEESLRLLSSLLAQPAFMTPAVV
jgi:DNA-binding transcriptional MocR family regulator